MANKTVWKVYFVDEHNEVEYLFSKYSDAKCVFMGFYDDCIELYWEGMKTQECDRLIKTVKSMVDQQEFFGGTTARNITLVKLVIDGYYDDE